MTVQAQKPPKTIKAAEGFVNNFVDDLYREETPSNEEGPNSKRVKELIARAERLLHKACPPFIQLMYAATKSEVGGS